MNLFRATTPKRRAIATEVNSYGEHRNDLRIDYKNRCGYCDDIDTWRNVWFEIDHFVPKEYLKTIKITDYSNLVYACRSCNNAKRAKWPTKDEKIYNRNNEGFIDPCDDNYDNQFTRAGDGRIVYATQLGEWIYNALKLYKPQHEIIWNIEKMDSLIDEINETLSDTPDSDLKDRLLQCHNEFRNYIKALGAIGL